VLTHPYGWHMLHDMQRPITSDTPTDWITAHEVAAMYGVHRNTVREWAVSGLIPSHPLPSGRRRFRRSEIEALIATRETRA